MKIIDKIKAYDEKPFFSFEYFPPKTEIGVSGLYDRLDRMARLEPAWIDVTWGAGGSTSQLTSDICLNAQKYCGVEVMMHLTCTNITRDTLKEALTICKEGGVQNILALRGDPPHGEEWKEVEGGFKYAGDLVKYIKEEFGDYFGICVAGYPEGHTEAISYEDDLKHLKEKIDAGADFIITQLFYDCDLFFKFVKDCRDLGITCPIVPGMMPIQNYGGFNRMTTMCKTYVPQSIHDALLPHKDDDAAVKEYGVQLCVKMCKKLLAGGVKALHFYTLNLEKSVSKIVMRLGLSEDTHLRREMPWRRPSNREKESVRPVYWKFRPKVYIQRTECWDDFPNGRWGDASSPAYGDLNDYHLMSLHYNKGRNRKKLWGESLKSIDDVAKVFQAYVKGEVAILPWSSESLANESDSIKGGLSVLNQNNLFTVNSQPRVNGVPSSDPVHGWGGEGGFCYQKAYIEFFCSKEMLAKVIDQLNAHPTLSYLALTRNGDEKSNVKKRYTETLTWGVFPSSKVHQPTIACRESFAVWTEEAFALWNSWKGLYDDDEASRKVIEEIQDNWFLVSVVDSDYVNGNIFDAFYALFGNANGRS
eukprot:TRINITY_DN10687_c0_g1_i1.p1 TRINITY_DN10687_c0_g1~~TRINITY_DN10687_c0_g1_i1.p1  ORF type:complete len:588 (-),score=189.29 TRINITY_DN10687_c0_g1_i1:61-1824(-)